MEKEWLVKTLALGIVVLFFGTAIQPSYAIVQSKEKINIKSKQIMIIGLIKNLRIITNIIRLKCIQEPEIVIKCQEILKVLIYSSVLKNISCSILFFIRDSLWRLILILGYADRIFLGILVLIPFLIIHTIWYKLCFQTDEIYKTISSISTTLNHIQINILECPCLQEK